VVFQEKEAARLAAEAQVGDPSSCDLILDRLITQSFLFILRGAFRRRTCGALLGLLRVWHGVLTVLPLSDQARAEEAARLQREEEERRKAEEEVGLASLGSHQDAFV
jgi:hypothetical protein